MASKPKKPKTADVKRTRKPPTRFTYDHAMPYRRYQHLRDQQKVFVKNKIARQNKKSLKKKNKK